MPTPLSWPLTPAADPGPGATLIGLVTVQELLVGSTEAKMETKLGFTRGDNRTLKVMAVTKDDTTESGLTPLNLTGATVKLTLKDKPSNPDALLVKTGTVTDGPGGQVEFALASGDTWSLRPGVCFFDVRATLASGAVYTLLYGTLDLYPDLTR